jgi:quercetin dioxygenase-like cupin family protein
LDANISASNEQLLRTAGAMNKETEMARVGQIITNPVSGEQIEFLETAASTNGERLVINLVLAPDGKVPGMHVHPKQEERFEVIAGNMEFRMGLKKIEAGPGDTVTVPKGKAHKFANAGETTAVVRVTVTPALEMERLFETTVELAHEGRVTASGMPRPLDLALFVKEFGDEVRGPGSPGALQRAMLSPLAAIGRMRGHDERYVQPQSSQKPAIA